MKKTILVVLMVALVAIPCFAQEVETDGLFSIEGTLWETSEKLIYSNGEVRAFSREIGFYQGNVWTYREGSGWFPSSTRYINLPMIGVAHHFSFQLLWSPSVWAELFIMQPSVGFGVLYHASYGARGWTFESTWDFRIGVMFKIEDNWIPEQTILFIQPSEGEPGTTLTNVEIEGRDTTFQDNPPVEISFDPPDGLTVSNINVRSNTEIEFDLEIDVDAPEGYRTVIVTYDDGQQSITRASGFAVNEIN